MRLEVIPCLAHRWLDIPLFNVFCEDPRLLDNVQGIRSDLRISVRLHGVDGEFLRRFNLINECFQRRRGIPIFAEVGVILGQCMG